MAMPKMMAMVMLSLLAMTVQPSMQQILKNPAETFKINTESPAYGIIASSSSTEKALNASSIFTVESSVMIKGRTFLVGKILMNNVVYVNTGNRPQTHVGITTEIMAEHFNLRGVIVIGSAGAVNNSVKLGDVVVPGKIAHTGVWTWKKYGASSNGQLDFGKFNTPDNGENLLGSITFNPSEVYDNGELVKDKFWIRPDARWLSIARRIEFASTNENCWNPRKLGCLGATNKVVVGTKASTSDAYVQNYAYREFLWYTFKMSTVDTTSHAAGLGAMSNGLRFIAFRGISNDAGRTEENKSSLANANLVKALYRFIFLDSVPREAPAFEDQEE